MPSELRNLESLYLHIRESHDIKISKIIKRTEYRHAKVILKCLSDLANLLIKETELKARVAVLIKEARSLTKNFVKSKKLTAKFEIRSKFEEIKNLVVSCENLSKTVQTGKFVDNFLLKFNKF